MRSSARGRRGAPPRARADWPRHRVELAQEREDLVADTPAPRRPVRIVDPHGEPVLRAVGVRLLPGHVEQRPDDSVLAPGLDPARGAARDDPVEHRLDLVGGGVTRRAQPEPGGRRVARLAHRRLGRSRLDPDDARAHQLDAVLGVRVGVLPADAVVDVDGRTS